MNKSLVIVIGAGLWYWLDPRGGERRQRIRERIERSTDNARASLHHTGRELRRRAWDVAADAAGALPGASDNDARVAERVRATVARGVSYPRAIDVQARGGEIILRGPVLAHEVDWLISRVWSARGVRSVVNQLEPHDEAGTVPGLQGEPANRQRLDGEWGPALRVAAGAGGGAAMIAGARTGGIVGTLIGVSGIALIARAITNMDLSRLTGIGAGRRGVVIEKYIEINAPVERVYELWSNCENLPHFMAHVREVRLQENGWWHWVVDGPAGAPVEFDSIITIDKPNRRLAWKTVPGSAIQHAGMVGFRSNADRSTRVHVRLTYNPVAGALGHIIAKLLGVDPKKQMDDDLLRLKGFIESGHAPQDTGAVRH